MKILMTLPSIGAVYGGPSQSVLQLVKAIGAQGVTIDFVTTNSNGDRLLDVPLQVWIDKASYRIQYFPCRIWDDYKWSQALFQWLFQSIHHYDLAHVNAIFSLTNLPIYWAAQRHQVPYVVTPRGMLEPWALGYKQGKKKFYYHLLEKPALQKAKVIHALAPQEADRLLPLQLSTPIAVIPNGIHSAEFEVLPDPVLFHQAFPGLEHKNIILFLGRIDPKKGLDLLAPAFAQVLDHFPTAHLVIAGPDNIGFLPTAQSYFQKVQCSHTVTFTGMLTGDLKKAALAAAQVYVAPSYSEGFSISVLEGMVSGLPCVITTGCNFPEAATAQAAYVVDINSESIAQALIQCLANPQAAKEMGERARQLIFSDYTWDSIAQKMIEVYDAILNDRPIPYVL